MTDDPLGNSISVKGKLTDAGFEAKAKSRALSALDRLTGNVFDWAGSGLERKAARDRALVSAEQKVIAAAGEKLSAEISSGSIDLERAIANLDRIALRRQANKDAVAKIALDDLASSPPNEEDSSTGETTLDEDFMNRFERYAEDASSDELRSRFGKVLASEIRKPGTFSLRILRCVDELSKPCAEKFLSLAQFSDGEVIFHALCGELKFLDAAMLTSEGLLLETGLGNTKTYSGHFRHDELDYSVVPISRNNGRFFAIEREADFAVSNIHFRDGNVTYDCYVLTDVGRALFSLTDISTESVMETLLAETIKALVSGSVARLEVDDQSKVQSFEIMKQL